MELTQSQIDVLSQNLRKKRIRIELLDFELKTIDSIEGHAIGGSITANAKNDIRRSGNIQLAIPIDLAKSTLFEKLDGFTIEYGGKIWLDRYIKIFVGIDNILSIKEETQWYKLGVFLINQPVRSFSSDTFTISFECIDLMAKLTGKRQGQLTGQTTLIEKGYYDSNNNYIKTKLSDVFGSVISELGGFTKYTIYPIPAQYQYLPYDIKLGVGSTVYDILKELMNIIPTWQIYFDLDGILIIEPIPSGENSITYEVEPTHYITNDLSVNFENVKNQVVVYGRVNTLTYYTENTEEETENVSYSENTLKLNYSKILTDSLLINSTTFGFKSLNIPNSLELNKVEIISEGSTLFTASLVKFENSTKSFGVEYNSTQIEPKTILPNEIYFIRIFDAVQTRNADNTETIDITKPIVMEFMGKQSVSYNLVNDNKESPFYINKNIKEENYYAGLAETPNGVEFGAQYSLKLNNDKELTKLNNGTIITFIANANNIYASGVNSTTINIYNSEGELLLSDIPLVQNIWSGNSSSLKRIPIVKNKISNDYTIWTIKYEIINDIKNFVLIGRCQHAITKICSSGEYDNIYSDQLAYERCLYELFNASNTNDSITIGIIPNYLLDVNCRIPYNPNYAIPRNIYDKKNDKIQYYITKQMTFPLGLENTAQSVSAIRIYDSGNLVGQDY